MGSDGKLYQHTGTVLLRAAATALTSLPGWWPEPTDTDACGRWLKQVWADTRFADAVRQASGDLATRVDAICSGQQVRPKQVRRVAMATVRYVLRAAGRPTPFGLFAGVAPVSVGSTPNARWGDAHRAVARVDTEWLDDVIVRLEACPDLLERLDVVLNNLAAHRGGRLHVPHGGPMGATVRRTSAVRVVEDLARGPVRFAALAEQLAVSFPRTEPQNIGTLLGSLVREKFLITSLRAPMTDTDPLSRLIERLHGVDARTVPQAAQVMNELEAVQRAVHEHNRRSASTQGTAREELTGRLRRLSDAGRSPLAVDLLLDAEVRIPESVARDMERAADVLLRLTRLPTGQGVWKEYQVAFWERYGTGTLVPVKEVVDPVSGLGYPAEYPGSRMTAPPPAVSERDERLLALAWQALADGSREIILTDDLIDRLADEAPTGQEAPPHVEMCARLHADSLSALERGDFTLTVAPARAAGTDDRTRRLQLDVPAHAAVLRAHLDRDSHAVLTEAPTEESYGWIGGHVHEIALPMTSTRPPARDPLSGFLPVLTNSTLGPVPGAVHAPWLNAKIYTHPGQFEELIGTHLARLVAQLEDSPEWWFVRYRTPHDLDHLRLRIRTCGPRQYAAHTESVARWAAGLRREGLSSRLVFDTYTPEIGRYGPGAALRSAEAVFTADSAYAVAALRGPGAHGIDGRALAATGMVDIACGMLGAEEGMRWMADHPASPVGVERDVSDQAVELVRRSTPRDRGWGDVLTRAWHRRAAALARYRECFAESMDLDAVLESLLHMHHNRLRGLDREDERICCRLARQSTVAWSAWPGENR
ncbi:lantibiotic dehydratase [Streptomyces sp. NPDC006012]|uniref:lantibiotic dehydratase n=1 Tax=Streptomyces sp. NPDC006012 TaxID=3364739 RepID=UPI0036A403CC